MHFGNFLEFIQLNLRVNDLVDISLFSCFVYYVVKYFMAKPQRPLVTFSLFVSFLYLFSRFFDLILISELLKLLFTVILVIVAIVFQRDIRRIIEHLSSKISPLKDKQVPMVSHRDKIATTIKNLAAKKVGAILVFTGNSPVNTMITGGKLLYSHLDSDLVESIFDARTPGHDGAMLIENGSIIRISCQLPLSKGTKLSPNLGTRHSAALGLSERSDSLIFVVSEERGSVSIAENSRLIYDVSDKFIEFKLSHYFKMKQRKVRSKVSLFESFKKNIPLKASSVVIAALAWALTIYDPGISYTSFMMPIEVRNLRSEFMIDSISDDIVKVTLSGPSSYINQLKKTTQKIILDFQKAEDGKTIFSSADFKLDFPKNITVHGYQPNTISVVLAEYEHKQLPILLKTKGVLSPSLDISGVTITPSGKRVFIPKSFSAKDSTLLTDLIDLSKVSKDNYRFKAKVSLPEKVLLQNDESFFCGD